MMQPEPLSRQLAALRVRRFDLIHIQTPFVAHYAGVRLARRLGVPCIETYHTFFEEYLFHYLPILPKSAWRAVARLLSRRQCNRLDGLVVPSAAMRDVLVRYGVRTTMRVIPTGMPGDAFVEGDGAAFRARHGIAPGRPTLVFVGRVAFEKNIEFLLRVAAELKRTSHPDIALIVAGEGPAETPLRRLGTELGLADNLRFVGYLERGAELNGCYRAGDAFVFASRTETQGLVLLEAMSLSVPVVSTAVMGTRDILAAGQGALVAEENVANFAAQVRRLLDDTELRQRLGPNCVSGWARRAGTMPGSGPPRDRPKRCWRSMRSCWPVERQLDRSSGQQAVERLELASQLMPGSTYAGDRGESSVAPGRATREF